MNYEHELITARMAAELPPRLPLKSTALLARAAVQTHHLIRQLLPTVQSQTQTLFTFEEGLEGHLELIAEDLLGGGRATCPAAHVAVLFTVDQEQAISAAQEDVEQYSTGAEHEVREIRADQVSLQLYTLAYTAKLVSEPGSVFDENAQQAQALARASMILTPSGGEHRCLN